jgi:Icc-related predicted phosphoesterase
VTSDFHGSVEAAHKTVTKARSIEAATIVVCGDITHFGSVKDAEAVLSPLIASGIPTLYVPGNCDSPELVKTPIPGAVYLHGTCVSQTGVSFLGLGGAPLSPFHTLFELSESEITRILNGGFKQCSSNRWFIVVSHATPRDTRVDLAFSGVHAGSMSLRRFIEENRPNAVFGGHIHEARAIDHIGETIIVNPGPARHGNCAVAELSDKVNATLDSL